MTQERTRGNMQGDGREGLADRSGDIVHAGTGEGLTDSDHPGEVHGSHIPGGRSEVFRSGP